MSCQHPCSRHLGRQPEESLDGPQHQAMSNNVCPPLSAAALIKHLKSATYNCVQCYMCEVGQITVTQLFQNFMCEQQHRNCKSSLASTQTIGGCKKKQRRAWKASLEILATANSKGKPTAKSNGTVSLLVQASSNYRSLHRLVLKRSDDESNQTSLIKSMAQHVKRVGLDTHLNHGNSTNFMS